MSSVWFHKCSGLASISLRIFFENTNSISPSWRNFSDKVTDSDTFLSSLINIEYVFLLPPSKVSFGNSTTNAATFRDSSIFCSWLLPAQPITFFELCVRLALFKPEKMLNGENHRDVHCCRRSTSNNEISSEEFVRFLNGCLLRSALMHKQMLYRKGIFILYGKQHSYLMRTEWKPITSKWCALKIVIDIPVTELDSFELYRYV